MMMSPSPVNARRKDKRQILPEGRNEAEKPGSSYVDEIRVLSALSLVLGLSFLGIFNGFMNHSFTSISATCTEENTPINNITLKKLRIVYVVLGTVGFMDLFSAALICYELFLVFKKNKLQDDTREGFWLNVCYFYVFMGIVISFASHAVGLYMVHCDRDNVFLSYIIPLVVMFVLTVLVIALIGKILAR